MGTLHSDTPSRQDILDFLSRRPRQFATSADQQATVTAIAVTSIDGRGAIGGTSGALGNDTDATIFNTLRALCDVVFVGTGTIAAENYGPVEIPDHLRDLRNALGRAEYVVMATLSRSLNLDTDSDFFSGSKDNPPIIFTPFDDSFASEQEKSSRREKIAALKAVGATVIALDDASVESALRWLKARGFEDIVVEGGPTVYREALKAECVDELFLTLSPTWVGSGPLTFGQDHSKPTPQKFELRRLLRADAHVFLRYSRALPR